MAEEPSVEVHSPLDVGMLSPGVRVVRPAFRTPRNGQWVLFQVALPPHVRDRHTLPVPEGEEPLPAVHTVTDAEGQWYVGVFDAGGTPHCTVDVMPAGAALEAADGKPVPSRPARVMLQNVRGDNVEAIRVVNGRPEVCNVGYALEELQACKPLASREQLPPKYLAKLEAAEKEKGLSPWQPRP